MSKFPCSLGDAGGFVNFKNSGQRGKVKEFTISLASILSGLQDIKSNIGRFQKLTNYVEKEWREAGSEHFEDPVLNSMITVQTKPCFTTLSKIISWANDASENNYDDSRIDLRIESLEKAIGAIENLSSTFTPKKYQKKLPRANLENGRNTPPLKLSKPFVLLAGISGTGKSRFVREQAKSTGSTSTAYCLVSVRPDWHEPSDLLGYVSRLNGSAEYVTTDVLQFIAKSWRALMLAGISVTAKDFHTHGKRLVAEGSKHTLDHVLPHWLCLDEMNLAPVEQYFSDYLSLLETREWQWDGNDFEYLCDPILKASTISQLANPASLRKQLGLADAQYDTLWQLFSEYGIGIPFNLIVAGTVNMDETAHGFSRKVIDRALSFDFGAFFPNKFDEFFNPTTQHKTLSYPIWSHASLDDLPAIDSDGKKSIAFLEAINKVLVNSPFQLAYRALNELLLAISSQRPQDELTLKAVWDDFLMCKVLPRIEGDSDKLRNAPSLLEELTSLLSEQLSEFWNEPDNGEKARPDLYRENVQNGDKTIRIACRSKAKLEWMKTCLASAGFTSFWP